MTRESPNEFSLRVGLVFTTGKTTFSIEAIHNKDIVLKDNSNHETKIINEGALISAYINGTVSLISSLHNTTCTPAEIKDNENEILSHLPLSDLSQAQIEHVVRVVRYVRGMRSQGYTCLRNDSLAFQHDLDKLREKYGDKTQVKSGWLYKWSLKLDRANGDPRAVIPRFDERGGANKSRIDQKSKSAIEQAIQNHLNDKESRIRTIDVKKDAEGILRSQDPTGATLPLDLSWCTVDRAIKNVIPPYALCVRRKGELVARRKYRDWYPRDRAEYPLEVFETDDTDAGVFLVDDVSGLPFGRAWITGVIDQNTSAFPGWELSEQPRSVWSALNALVNAILPSDTSLSDFAHCSEPSEFYGRPGIVVFDNALYNHAFAIEVAALEMGFTLAWAKPKTPQEKSKIEGWNRIVKREYFSELPGWRGDLSDKEGLARGTSSANMGMLEFRQLFTKWTSDIYSNTPCQNGLTPRQAWHVNMRSITPRLPLDIHGLRITACIPETRKLRPEGLLFRGIIYSSPTIQALRKRYGHNAEIKFKYNPKDLGYVYIFDPALKNYFKVDAVDIDYASGLTLYQHKLVLKMMRDLKVKNPKTADLLIYREELRKLTHQLRFSNKQRERKIAMRTGDIPTNENSATQEEHKFESITQTELESSVFEIDAIEHEYDEDEWKLPVGF